MCLLRATRRAVLAASLVALPLASASLADDRVLRIVAPWTLNGLELANSGYVFSRMQIAEPLVGVAADGSLEGRVAESWDVADDGLTWRFRVREGLRFHDDTEVTAAAVVASLERSRAAGNLAALPIATLRAEDRDVVIVTERPFSPLPALLMDYTGIILAPSSFDAEGRVQTVVGTGPFRLTATDGDGLVEAEAFAGYWGAVPAIGHVRYTAAATGETRTNIALAGDADIVFTVDPAAIARIEAAGTTVTRTPIPRVRLLNLNLERPPFDDGRVREALSLAIDREGIAIAVLRDPASAATQLVPPFLHGWHDPDLTALAYDPDRARALLDAAGWAVGPDGVRKRDGERLEARLVTYASRPEMPAIATALEQQLDAVGIALEIVVTDAAVIPESAVDGTLEMGLVARSYGFTPEPIGRILSDFTSPRPAWGSIGWPGHGAVAELADRYIASFDDAAKADLRHAIVRRLHDELPVVPIAWYEHNAAVSPAVGGLVLDPYETSYYLDRLSWQ